MTGLPNQTWLLFASLVISIGGSQTSLWNAVTSVAVTILSDQMRVCVCLKPIDPRVNASSVTRRPTFWPKVMLHMSSRWEGAQVRKILSRCITN